MKINTMLKSHKVWMYGGAFLFGMLGAWVVLLASHFIMSPKPAMGTVNITGLVDRFIKIETAKHLPQALLKEEVKAFGQHLERELKWISSKNHIVLLPSEAVIAGCQDYTTLLKERLNQYR